MKGAVITGPTGAIGMALIKKCIEQKANVFAICHKGSKRIAQIPVNEYVKVLALDLADYASFEEEAYKELSEFGDKYGLFMHLAWNGTFGDTRNNMNLQSDKIDMPWMQWSWQTDWDVRHS